MKFFKYLFALLVLFAATTPATAQIRQRTDRFGGVVGAMLNGTPVNTAATTTSAATAMPGAAGTEQPGYLRITFKTATTADFYICWNFTTTCSATAFDVMIPSGAAAGTEYFSQLPTGIGAVYYYSTAAANINATKLASGN